MQCVGHPGLSWKLFKQEPCPPAEFSSQQYQYDYSILLPVSFRLLHSVWC